MAAHEPAAAVARFAALVARAAETPRSLSAAELAFLLSVDDAGAWAGAFAAARTLAARIGRADILPRGLIECANVCAKDCLYCGIRASNAACRRYRLTRRQVLERTDEALRRGYPAVAFQAGEVASEANTRFYEDLIADVRARAPSCEITLSLGEQSPATYRRWKAAAGSGILRYLLRIETSNRRLYASVHPASCSFDRRVGCIRTLRELGYVTGSGVMVGLPGQTTEDLARDLVFFADERLDMVGLGPYVPHPDTPLGQGFAGTAGAWADPARRLDVAVRMIALVRLHLHDVNIVASTALEALAPGCGRERGLAAGANVVMPDLTPDAARIAYDLYPGKAEAVR